MSDNKIIILDEATSEEIVVEVGNTETSIMIDVPFAGAMGKASASYYGIVKIGEGIQVIDGVISIDASTISVDDLIHFNEEPPEDSSAGTYWYKITGTV